MKEGRKVLDLVSTLLKLINFGLKKHKVSFNSDSNLWNNLFQRKPNRIRILELPLGNISIEILAYFVIFLMLKMERITLLHRTCTYSSVQPNAIWLQFMTSCWGRSFIDIISQRATAYLTWPGLEYFVLVNPWDQPEAEFSRQYLSWATRASLYQYLYDFIWCSPAHTINQLLLYLYHTFQT